MSDSRKAEMSPSTLSEEDLGGMLSNFSERPLDVRWKGLSLPYQVFSNDQRVSHTAIIENKRLGHALALAKAQQDLNPRTRVMTNSDEAETSNQGLITTGRNVVSAPRSTAVSIGP